ncbi:MAG: hypothetical protein NVSMB70_15320 [Chamaesiphon sp.]
MTQLLNLPEVAVESSLQEGQTLILSVSKKAKSGLCPQWVHSGVKSQNIYIKIKNIW